MDFTNHDDNDRNDHRNDHQLWLLVSTFLLIPIIIIFAIIIFAVAVVARDPGTNPLAIIYIRVTEVEGAIDYDFGIDIYYDAID